MQQAHPASARSNTIGRPSTSRALAAVAGLTLVMITLLGAAAPATAAGPLPPPAERADNTLVSEGFEGAFPGTAWTVGDNNLTFGTDSWSTTSYRVATGTRSAYSAGFGDRQEYAVAFFEDFENGTSAWSMEDTDTQAGDDYWGLSDYRANTGTYSMWCAQEGINWEFGDYDFNYNYMYYDDRMETTLWRTVDLKDYANATLDYWYYLDSELTYDFFYVAYFDGGWNYVNAQDGQTNGWVHDSFSIPTTATEVGFFFDSDDYTVAPGVWVDDVTLSGQLRIANDQAHRYDDGMDTAMTRNVDFSGYEWARVDYQFWIETEVTSDYLEVIYFTDSWRALDRHDGASGGWLSASVEIPVTATGLGFRFVSNGDARFEGAYVDEVRFIGSVGKLLCSAVPAPPSGIEGITPFNFTPTVGGGLRPLIWHWEFGDGTTSSAGAPTHTFSDTGTYVGLLSVRDQLGQLCSAPVPSLFVDHVVSTITITPPHSEVIEGTAAILSAFDARGHVLNFTLQVDPPSCGVVSMQGSAVVLNTSTSAGGRACTVAASYAGVTGTAVVSVLHDTNNPSVGPTSASVVQAQSIIISSYDTFGHPLEVGWTASCGRVEPNIGTTTTFYADTLPGRVCQVTGQIERFTPSASITILPDTSSLSLTPQSLAFVEGDSARFSIFDHLGNPIVATWSVDPPSCGAASPATGTSTTFVSSSDSGGSSCTVTGAVGSATKAAVVTVAHDWSAGTMEPGTATVEEGTNFVFNAFDAHHHAASAQWSVAPAACGEVSPLDGPSTTFYASTTSGGQTCTVTAAKGSVTLRAQVAVVDGPPATVDVVVEELQAGKTAAATGTAKDAAGRSLPGSAISWTTTCADVSPSSGGTVTVSASADDAKTTCQVTARAGTISKTVDVLVAYARPYTVTIVPSAGAAGTGSAQKMTVRVTDAAGNVMDPGTVTWTTTCGTVTGSGSEATFTAPGAPGECSVSASVGIDGTTATGAVGVPVQSSGPSSMLLFGGVAAAAAAAVLAVLLMRKKKGGPKTPEAPKAAPPEAPPTADAPEAPKDP